MRESSTALGCVLLTCALLLPACAQNEPFTDAGGARRDAGFALDAGPRADAGPRTDAGSTGSDAGARRDAGPGGATDAGSVIPGLDSSFPSLDAAFPGGCVDDDDCDPGEKCCSAGPISACIETPICIDI